jgi:hypothetical protein
VPRCDGGGRLALFDPVDYPITFQLQDIPALIPPRSHVPAGFIHGANMAFRRDILVEIGGFDPSFMSGGDVEASSRLLRRLQRWAAPAPRPCSRLRRHM